MLTNANLDIWTYMQNIEIKIDKTAKINNSSPNTNRTQLPNHKTYSVSQHSELNKLRCTQLVSSFAEINSILSKHSNRLLCISKLFTQLKRNKMYTKNCGTLLNQLLFVSKIAENIMVRHLQYYWPMGSSYQQTTTK